MNELDSAATGRRGLWTCWLGVLLLAGAGAAVCWMILLAYSGQSAILESQWFCGEYQFESYGCSGVFASRYGKILGVPLPAFGVLYFLMIVIWLVAFGRHAFNSLFVAMIGVGMVVSVALLAILYLVLPGQCRWCLLVHLCNFAIIVVGSLGAWRFYHSGAARPLHTYWPRGIIVGLVVLALAGWAGAAGAVKNTTRCMNLYRQLRLSTEFQLWRYRSQPPRDMKITQDDPMLGPADATVKVVVYKDFQCEYCGEAWTILHDLYRQKYAATGKVALIVRHWPQSKRCNEHIGGDWHPYACPAAWASQAAAQLAGNDGFWKYHQLLVENHDRLDRNPYLELAQQIGLAPEKFAEACKSGPVREKIQRDIRLAKALGVTAVPAIFINGRYFEGWKRIDLIEQLIDEQLAGPSSRPAAAQPAKNN